MDNFKYKSLFEPIKIGKTLFRNRMFAAPTGPRVLPPGDFLGEEAFKYYERKAIGGAASVAVGECHIDSIMGKSALHHISLDNPYAGDSLFRLTDAISRHGAVAVAELNHGGMFANRQLTGEAAKAYGPMEGEINGKPVIAMTEEIIEKVISQFVAAALFAKQCGFGMVLIHAGHGWLFSQFMSQNTNKRKDRWGGSIQNRTRLAVCVVDAIHKTCGKDFPVEIRISGSECYAGGYDIEEGIEIAKQLDGHADIIHVSAGSHEVEEVFTITHPSLFLEEGCNAKYAAEIKKHVKAPVATVGALSDPEFMEELIASGKADIVEMARALIAEPDLPNKARSGRESEIKKCMRCLHCFSKHTVDGSFHCAITPTTGRELEFKPDIPPKYKKTVLVAGGGIGGMQAALTCAERGHKVILCEKTDRLGGVLRCEEQVPFKKRLDEYLNYQENALGKTDVEVRVGTPVTPELADSISPDVIIASLGATPIKPSIPGIDGVNVLSAEDAYKNASLIGKRTAIIGGGLVGSELAVYLAQLGREVTVVEILDKLNDGGNRLHMIGVRDQFKKNGITTCLNTKVSEINKDKLYCDGLDGEFTIDADTVIYAVGYEPRAESAIELRYCAPEFYQIGDCVSPKNIMNATSSAFTIACDIGMY